MRYEHADRLWFAALSSLSPGAAPVGAGVPDDARDAAGVPPQADRPAEVGLQQASARAREITDSDRAALVGLLHHLPKDRLRHLLPLVRPVGAG